MNDHPSPKLRWGILGSGNIAHRQTADLLANGFQVGAVGSRSDATARAFAGEFALSSAYGSYEELVADESLDIIYVSTPHSFHAEHAALALNAGKHVLVEKSFTINARQARAVTELASAKGLVVLEAMWTRFLPHMRRAREIVASGKIGEVRAIIADHSKKLSSDPTHRLNNPALGGGALLDLGIYPVSFAWSLLGRPASIQAHAAMTATGVDRQTSAILGYANGEQAILHCALDAAGPTSASVIGTKGWIEFEPDWYKPSGFTVYGTNREFLERFDGSIPSRGMQFQAWEIERRIRLGERDDDILPAVESVEIMEGLDEIRRQIGLAYPGE
ncbi:MAG: gfo/Idh/MocA family oxidoreductase [Microbacteriaceae bacterium]|jgi:predicted dehydrogenase|nr:gfo/Idh/MocA family oxidoreductase [Microbacteriaceae bacterium]